MATRSHIGKKLEDGTVKYIYCHFDGYPDHNGEILQEHYNDEAKIDALLELGDISILAPEIGQYQDFNDHENRNPFWCLAYGRDRGDKDTQAKFEKFDDYVSPNFVDYCYVFNNGKWECYGWQGQLVI